MTERPILFSGSMIRAILAETKTQTRRLVTGKTALEWLAPDMFTPEFVADPGNFLCPYGYAGDRLWVRETWDAPPGTDRIDEVAYRADYESDPDGAKWRPSIFMPRWASRLTLEITGVRVERLQSLGEEDARSEGVQAAPFCKAGRTPGLEHVEAFEDLWDSLNGKRAPWSSNPWVWVIAFRRIEAQERAVTQ